MGYTIVSENKPSSVALKYHGIVPKKGNGLWIYKNIIMQVIEAN